MLNKIRSYIRKRINENFEGGGTILSVGDEVSSTFGNSIVNNIELTDEHGNETGKTVQHVPWDSMFVVDLNNGRWAKRHQIKPIKI